MSLIRRRRKARVADSGELLPLTHPSVRRFGAGEPMPNQEHAPLTRAEAGAYEAITHRLQIDWIRAEDPAAKPEETNSDRNRGRG